jgi:hypothetical protein
MKGLKVVLWICAVALLLNVIGLVIPLRVIAKWCDAFGVVMPLHAMSSYMIRVCQACSVLMGAFLVILAKDPLKYGPMVLLAGYGAIFLALVVLVAVWRYMLPPIMYADVPICLVVGLLILFFRGKAFEEQSAPQAPQTE